MITYPNIIVFGNLVINKGVMMKTIRNSCSIFLMVAICYFLEMLLCDPFLLIVVFSECYITDETFFSDETDVLKWPRLMKPNV